MGHRFSYAITVLTRYTPTPGTVENIVASQAVERVSWVRVSEIERETCNNNVGDGAGLLNLSLGLLHVQEF